MSEQEALTAALAQIDKAFGKDAPPYVPTRPAFMTEVVARQLCYADAGRRGLTGDDRKRVEDAQWEGWIEAAQDVFGAMATATDEMLDDVEGWQGKDAWDDLETERERIEFIWHTMLDCAEYEFDEVNVRNRADQAAWDALTPEQREERLRQQQPEGSDLPF